MVTEGGFCSGRTMEVNRNIKKPRSASRGFPFFEIFRSGYSRRLPIWGLARCGFLYWRLAPLPFTGRGWDFMRRDHQAAVGGLEEHKKSQRYRWLEGRCF